MAERIRLIDKEAEAKSKAYGDMARGDMAYHWSKMKRMKGETIEGFAARMYNWQMEIYSAYAGRDLAVPFHTQPPKIREQWIKSAQEHPEWASEKTKPNAKH